MSVIRKYHNDKLQTNPWHRGKEPRDMYSNKTSERQQEQNRFRHVSFAYAKRHKNILYQLINNMDADRDQKIDIDQHTRFRHLHSLHRQEAMTKASLRLLNVSPEHSLLAYTTCEC